MKVHATLSNLRIAPRKVRLVTHTIVGMDATHALTTLAKEGKRASLPIAKLLSSAIANAANNFGLAADNLFVAQVFVGDGLRLKRWMPKAFGRATPIIKRCSNVKIVLAELVEGQGRVTPKKPIAKKEEASLEGEPEKKQAEEKPSVTPQLATTTENKTKSPKAGFAKKVFQRKSV